MNRRNLLKSSAAALTGAAVVGAAAPVVLGETSLSDGPLYEAAIAYAQASNVYRGLSYQADIATEDAAIRVRKARYSELLAVPCNTSTGLLVKLNAVISDIGWRNELDVGLDPSAPSEADLRAIIADLDRLLGEVRP